MNRSLWKTLFACGLAASIGSADLFARGGAGGGGGGHVGGGEGRSAGGGQQPGGGGRAVRPPIRVAEINRRSIALRRLASRTPVEVSRELSIRNKRRVLHNRRFTPERVRRWDRMRDEFNRVVGGLVSILPACRAEPTGESPAQPVNLGKTMAEVRITTSEPGHN